jgi:hypothetical protein
MAPDARGQAFFLVPKVSSARGSRRTVAATLFCLVPKLRLGTHSAKLCFATVRPVIRSPGDRKQSFQEVRAQTEFGHEKRGSRRTVAATLFRPAAGRLRRGYNPDVHWREESMSIVELIPAVRGLSRSEKFQLAQILLEDLASEELPTIFKEGQVYPIYTPEYAPDAAAQLAQVLKNDGTRS